MIVTILAVHDIRDTAWVGTVRRALIPVGGVAGVAIDAEAKTVTVRHDPDLVSTASLVMRLEHLGLAASLSSV